MSTDRYNPYGKNTIMSVHKCICRAVLHSCVLVVTPPVQGKALNEQGASYLLNKQVLMNLSKMFHVKWHTSYIRMRCLAFVLLLKLNIHVDSKYIRSWIIISG